MATPAILLRDAVPADALALARLHHALWHETYGALAPPDVPPLMTLESRVASWRATLDAPGQDDVFVAQEGRDIAGFARIGPAGDAALGGGCEVKHIFVKSSLHGRGLGRRLMAEAARRALSRGFDRLALGVVDGNAPAIAFYAALDGEQTGSYIDPGPRWRSSNLIFVWRDLASLARAGRP